MSTPKEVARAVSKIIKERNIEIAMPKISGILATLAYLFPRLRRAMRPSLYAKGKKIGKISPWIGQGRHDLKSY